MVAYETEFEVRKFIQRFVVQHSFTHLSHSSLPPSFPHTHTHRFSNNKIVRAYCLALSNYRNNSIALNHAAVKMLYRISVELKMAPLLFQISVFRIFHSILQEPATSKIHVSPSLTHSLFSLTHSPTQTLTYIFKHSLTNSLTHSPTQTLTYLPTHSLTNSLTHSLAHSLTHSLHHPH